MNEIPVGRVHWSFWLIVSISLVFSLLGCMNFITQMNAEMVALMPEAYRTIVESRPAWGTAAFAVAVFGGALGCVLLLLRRPVALYVFIVSLVGALLAQVPYVGMADFPREAWIGWLSQIVVGAFLIGFTIWAKGRGWIK